MMTGLKTGRDHHYLSDLEWWHHVLAEASPDVIEIKDQYALLPWEETQEIALDLGIPHPVYPGTKTPVVMTTDLVLTLAGRTLPGHQQRELVAISVKCEADVDIEAAKRSNPKINVTKKMNEIQRTLEKLRIEQEYWKRRKVQWKYSTENDISVNRAKNLAMLRVSMVSWEHDSEMKHLDHFVQCFYKNWEPYKTMNDIVIETGNACGLPVDVAFCLFGRAVWLRRLHVDLDTEELDHFLPVKLRENHNC